MANLMGSYAIWVKDGIVPLEETSIVSNLPASPVRWRVTFLIFSALVCTTGAEICYISTQTRI